jgi:recombination DNA repair RAD52 pathway protein
MKFKEYMFEEGDMFDALKHSVKTGVKAFRKKREEQSKRSEEKALTNQILTAEGDDLRRLIKQIVDKGLTVKNGEVIKPCRIKHMNKEVLEHVYAQRRNQAAESSKRRLASFDSAQAGKLVGHA